MPILGFGALPLIHRYLLKPKEVEVDDNLHVYNLDCL